MRRMAKAVLTILAEDIADQDELYDIYLLLFEAVTNVVRHAYSQDAAGDVEVRVRVDAGESVEFQVIDWGCGFPCGKVEVKNVAPEEEAGRGLLIMTGLSDEMCVEHNGERNIVALKRKIRNESWKACA